VLLVAAAQRGALAVNEVVGALERVSMGL
jgi:hypothetical protein